MDRGVARIQCPPEVAPAEHRVSKVPDSVNSPVQGPSRREGLIPRASSPNSKGDMGLGLLLYWRFDPKIKGHPWDFGHKIWGVGIRPLAV